MSTHVGESERQGGGACLRSCLEDFERQDLGFGVFSKKIMGAVEDF